MKRALLLVALLTAYVVIDAGMSGCAGWGRSWTSTCAQQLGADWIVVQYGYDGTPINCWKLEGVSVSNESASDGVYWKNEGGHLVHISGWYNRVQVSGGRFEEAAKLLGVEAEKITNGRYRP